MGKPGKCPAPTKTGRHFSQMHSAGTAGWPAFLLRRLTARRMLRLP